ncbi:MAG: C39 family peptidase [Anaerolineae bacterium]|jgi:hypothetical protein|nr:C39 family peptidase [Anaerolineae bacterium]
MKKRLLPVFLAALLVIVASVTGASATDQPPYYTVETVVLPDGATLERVIIAGPPHPPAGFERETVSPGAESVTAAKTLTVPAYGWTFGCSATAAAMIAAYYDRSAWPNMYVGPTNGGVMPMDSTVWGSWTDGTGDSHAQCPLAASRNGLDGRTTRGSIDDYWVAYDSTAQDPYIGRWTQHTYGDAIGDYMRTSQSNYSNPDGATAFYYNGSASPFYCATMQGSGIVDDGTVGRKLFYEARGYTVTDCYNQDTDNIGGGFTFAKYKAEIDAGHPVMINLVGHTVVGIGYDDTGSKVFLLDTWDSATHSMTWGGSYTGLPMESVSIARLACPAAGNVTNLAITKATNPNVTLSWSPVAGAAQYEIWSANNAPFFTPGANCASPAPFACQVITGSSLTTAALGSTANNYTYVAKAINTCGNRSASLSNRTAEFEFALTRP